MDHSLGWRFQWLLALLTVSGAFFVTGALEGQINSLYLMGMFGLLASFWALAGMLAPRSIADAFVSNPALVHRFMSTRPPLSGPEFLSALQAFLVDVNAQGRKWSGVFWVERWFQRVARRPLLSITVAVFTIIGAALVAIASVRLLT